MSNPSDVEARLSALEVDEVAADAAAARHLAAARDRDLADLGMKVDAYRPHHRPRRPVAGAACVPL